MTETRQQRSLTRRPASADERLARLMCVDRPPADLKVDVAKDMRDLEVKLMKARAALRLIGMAGEGVSDKWQGFALEAREATRG